MAQRVLVTGASGGFGRLIVETLRKQGHVVVASIRAVADRNRDAAVYAAFGMSDTLRLKG